MTNKPIPATPALPDVAEGTEKERNLAMLIKRIHRRFHKGLPLTKIIELAIQYVDRSGLTGSILRSGAGEQRGKWPECQRYESATGEIFNVRLVNKPENKIVYTRSDVDLNGIFTVTLSEWLADLGEQRGEGVPCALCHTEFTPEQWFQQKGKCPNCSGAGEQRGETPIISPDELADHHTGLATPEQRGDTPDLTPLREDTVTFRYDGMEAVTHACGLLDVIKLEWQEMWTEHDQAVRDGLSRMLTSLYAKETEHPSQEAQPLPANETKDVSDLLNSMKVIDRHQWHQECRTDILTKLMYELVAARAELSRLISKVWIDCKQELPPTYTTILAYAAGTSMYTMRLAAEGRWLINGEHYGGIVTHWQPLPTPPDSKED